MAEEQNKGIWKKWEDIVAFEEDDRQDLMLRKDYEEDRLRLKEKLKEKIKAQIYQVNVFNAGDLVRLTEKIIDEVIPEE